MLSLEFSFDLSAASAIFNTLTALFVLWFMQCTTRDWSFRDALGRLKFFHRVSAVILVMTLAYNVGWTIENEADPRMVDFIVSLAFLVTLVCSAIRHGWAVRGKAA